MVQLLLAILLAGCSSSNGMSNIYLLSLKYDNATSTSTPDPAQFNPDISQTIRNASWTNDWTISEVKVGYMGICVVQQTGDQLCASGADSLTNMLQARLLVWNQKDDFNTKKIDPLNLIWTAKYFKAKIIFSGLVYDDPLFSYNLFFYSTSYLSLNRIKLSIAKKHENGD